MTPSLTKLKPHLTMFSMSASLREYYGSNVLFVVGIYGSTLYTTLTPWKIVDLLDSSIMNQVVVLTEISPDWADTVDIRSAASIFTGNIMIY
jgi:hypothetical protein